MMPLFTQVGLGANVPEDAVYPMTFTDDSGKPLDGANNNYVLHFDQGATPPVDAFWSVTIYGADGYQVPNSINRFAVSNRMPFKYNPDGSLDLYIQNENPRRGQGGELASCVQGPVQPHHAHVRAQGGRAGRKVEPATGDGDPGAPSLDNAVMSCWNVHA
jgi:hypothetical protein